MRRLNVLSMLCLVSLSAAGADWKQLTNPAPANSLGTMLLLTDGSVIALDGDDSQHWLKLSPDIHGSYVHGTWTTLAPMRIPRLYFTSDVLQSGRVFVLGGEYTGPYYDSNIAPSGEIYDPLTNSWTWITPYPDEPGGCGTGTVTSDVELTTGSKKVKGIYSTDRIRPGWTISGTGIPANAVVTAVDSDTEVTISTGATITGVSKAVQFTGNLVACFGDDPSMLLRGGKILAGNIFYNSTYIYSISTNSWDFAAEKVYKDPSDEEGWTMLSSGAVLSYDLFESVAKGEGYAELYHPSRDEWTSISPGDGTAQGVLPVLSSPALGYELGPSLRLQDGRTIVIGANQHTALYTPGTNTWAAGPNMLDSLSNPFGTIENAKFGADDAPAALLPNGHVLLAADAGPNPVECFGNTANGSNVITHIGSTAGLQMYWSVAQANGKANVIPPGTYITSIDSDHQIHISNAAAANATDLKLVFGGIFSNPTRLFDFNPRAEAISPVSPPIPDNNLPFDPAYISRMLVLPNGELLFNDGASSQLWIYKSDGLPDPALWPTVTDIDYKGDGVFALSGKRLNGPSDGSAYGDDVQSNENYPIIRLLGFNSDVYYCRTKDWTSVKVGNGVDHETVEFTLNSSVTPGLYLLVISGSGVSSFPVLFEVTEHEIKGP